MSPSNSSTVINIILILQKAKPILETENKIYDMLLYFWTIHFLLKAAYSVTFDIFILKIMFLFFKNIVKILKFRYTFYLFRNN